MLRSRASSSWAPACVEREGEKEWARRVGREMVVCRARERESERARVRERDTHKKTVSE